MGQHLKSQRPRQGLLSSHRPEYQQVFRVIQSLEQIMHPSVAACEGLFLLVKWLCDKYVVGTTAETKTWLSPHTACFRHKCGFLISWLFVMNDLFCFSAPSIITKLLYSALEKKKSFNFFSWRMFFSYLFLLASSWQREILGHCNNCTCCEVA